MEKYKLSVFIFRNDLRLEDNTSLIEALKTSKKVIPIFIFNKKQISKENKYRSQNSMQFLKESLIDLNSSLKKHKSKLYLLYDKIDNVISNLKKDLNIEAVFLNKDYTPFARIRDKQIKKFCEKEKIKFNSFHDKLLLEPKKTLKINNKPYTIFTPFYNKNSLEQIQFPQENIYSNFFSEKIENSLDKFPQEFNYKNKNIYIKGGRENALKQLNSHLKNLNNYNNIRDFPHIEGTSKLSAHIRFGNISIRELYYFIKKNLSEIHPLLRQLYWRDFFYSIIYFFPKVIEKPFHEKYEKIKWENNKELFEKWKQGQTGFPIIDAGIRELNTTGYMHNRIRMIVASFLVKDLHINWQLGEKYFAQNLIDYDLAINNGNWQWAASTGCDAQPYFRIFNPWSQQIKFDENCTYIKKWIPELKETDPKIIHNIFKYKIKNYPKPIIDHKIESQISKEIFKKC